MAHSTLPSVPRRPHRLALKLIVTLLAFGGVAAAALALTGVRRDGGNTTGTVQASGVAAAVSGATKPTAQLPAQPPSPTPCTEGRVHAASAKRAPIAKASVKSAKRAKYTKSRPKSAARSTAKSAKLKSVSSEAGAGSSLGGNGWHQNRPANPTAGGSERPGGTK